jgi:N-acetylglutamate synthase-like GNAT family acetyltransferase
MLVAAAPGLGYPQAVMVAVASLWFAAIGFRLVGEDALPPTGRDPGPTPVAADARTGTSRAR